MPAHCSSQTLPGHELEHSCINGLQIVVWPHEECEGDEPSGRSAAR